MIDGYVRVGKLSEASNLLNMMPFKDVVAQTALINGYVQRMKMDEAHHIFREISTPDVVCWNTMISGYVQCGIMDEALELFMRMPKKDVVSWNTMIAGFIQNGFYVEALQHFKMMRKEGKDPDWSTFACALSGCANLAALQVGTQLHNLLLKSGHIIDIFAGNALITMYARCGRILTARQVFDEMVSVDLVSWNSLIAGHALNGYAKAAISIFQEMKKNGVAPDEVTFIGLLSACSHAGMVDDGLELFYSMSRDYPITPVAEHYACVVDLLGRAGRLGEALKLVKGMPIKANAGIWGSLLGACRMHKNPEVANVAAEKLFEFEPHTTSNYVLLSNIHAEAGSWGEVERVRVLMKERGVWKQPARSWIEIKNEVRSFSSDDSTEPRAAEVFMVLRVLNAQMRNIGHMSDSSLLDCG
ncbi:PPR repeat [Musa troglodytarum]|uniref:PPR repeat n=1 Tax=Musa troglodytarum TaxID=320322 RepID=A0A9E7EZD2_9LILI|nr:PPR repeat [Musa troglodytarum]